MLFRGLLFMLLMVAVVSCRKTSQRPGGVRYEVFVRSFADSNGDGIGDLNGIRKKLDYLEDLGVKTIWLMPIMKSPSYHKYDVIDYQSVDPEYGTMHDFQQLVTEVHERGMQIILDLPINHTSKDHPWFRAAVEQPLSKYHSYYVWENPDTVIRNIAAKKILFDTDNITQWHEAEGDLSGLHYYGFFSSYMPDLNFDNVEVKNEIVAIGKFWLQQMQADGFRLDGAKYIYPEDRAGDNHQFWAWFRNEMEKLKPGVDLVGEVWSDTEHAAPFVRGLHAVFNFDLSRDILRVVREATDTISLVDRYLKMELVYKKESTQHHGAAFLTNHDMDRVMSVLHDREDMARAAAGILLTLTDVPYVYYGEELGMRGKKPDELIREPFLWDTGIKDLWQTRWEQAVFSKDSMVSPWFVQRQNPQSIYLFYRSLIHYRNDHEAVERGAVIPTDVQMREVISFIKSTADENVAVLVNISDIEVTLRMEGNLEPYSTIDFDFLGTAAFEKEGLRIPAYSTLILKQ